MRGVGRDRVRGWRCPGRHRLAGSAVGRSLRRGRQRLRWLSRQRHRRSDGLRRGLVRGAGVIACDGGVAQADTCSPGAPSAEVCDAVDNDCDGHRRRHQRSDDLRRGFVCGAGGDRVRGGLPRRTPARRERRRPRSATGVTTTATGLDDGTDVRTTCGVGSCAATGVIACVGGVAQADTCSPEPVGRGLRRCRQRLRRPVDDGTDVPTTCGVGSCASAGVIACVGGVAHRHLLAGTPSAEVCDGGQRLRWDHRRRHRPPTTCGVGSCACGGRDRVRGRCCPARHLLAGRAVSRGLRRCGQRLRRDHRRRHQLPTTCGVGSCASRA